MMHISLNSQIHQPMSILNLLIVYRNQNFDIKGIHITYITIMMIIININIMINMLIVIDQKNM